MSRPGRIARCMGRVEFRACEAEILDMHRRGYANKHIYMKLAEEGKITLAYSTFNGHLRKLLDGENQHQPQKAPADVGSKKNFRFTVPTGTESIY